MTPFLTEEDLLQEQQSFSEENLLQENTQTIQEQNQQNLFVNRQNTPAPTLAPATIPASTPAPTPAPTTAPTAAPAAPAIALRQECFTRICDQTITGKAFKISRFKVGSNGY